MAPRDASPTLTVCGNGAVELPGLAVVVSTPRSPPLRAALGVAPVVIGTGAECDLVLDDPTVSRRHCEVALTSRGVVLRDLGSKNGVFLGDVQVVEVILPAGRSVTAGGATVSVVPSGAPSILLLSAAAHFGEALGGSVRMRALFAELDRAAATDATVLLLGESGTGKELLARGLHDASPRRARPFVVFDCGAVAPGLLEAELFGYLKGAFTGASEARAGLFEQAHRGTLFIDEVGELPLEMQPKLLRVLEARTVRRLGASAPVDLDVRVIAATHRDLRSRVAAGSFRADLYYRLAVIDAIVPPLRERKEDIPLMVDRFLAAQAPPRTLADLPPNTLELLQAHDWPGNVRELRNIVTRLLLSPGLGARAFSRLGAPASEGPAASPDVAAAKAAGVAPTGGGAGDAFAGLVGLPLREAREVVVEQFERAYIAAQLRAQGAVIARTADAMGVSRQLLHRLMVRYGIRGD